MILANKIAKSAIRISMYQLYYANIVSLFAKFALFTAPVVKFCNATANYDFYVPRQ